VVAIGWYQVIKFFHILLAIVAVGFNASYGVGSRERPSTRHTRDSPFAA
jgi:hypothetical protein